MARNEEKNMTMLNRWVRQKQELGRDKGQPFVKVPEDPMTISNLLEAENFRKRIVGGVIKRVSEIQNAALPEGKIRELNDQINQILRNKSKWEDRIKQLGGPDYKKAISQNQTNSIEANGIDTSSGYKYFGAAKNLPNVKEALAKELPSAPAENKQNLKNIIDHEYLGYGFATEDLEKQEAALELKLRQTHNKDMQNDFVKNKRQKLEQEMIGFQGENGTKLSGEVEISAISKVEFRNMFSLILEPEKYQEQIHSEATKYQKIDQVQTELKQAENLTEDDLITKLAEKKRKMLLDKYQEEEKQ